MTRQMLIWKFAAGTLHRPANSDPDPDRRATGKTRWQPTARGNWRDFLI